MGNYIGGRRKAKVMKIDGQTLKFKTPIRAWDVVKDYPGHVLLESSAVRRFGIRAKPLEPQQGLNDKKIYFLVELPKFPEDHQKATPRRARSAVTMTAKDRLECLMLSRRSASDISFIRPSSSLRVVSDGPSPSNEPVRVKMRLPKAQMAKLMEESRDGREVAEKIIDLYIENDAAAARDAASQAGDVAVEGGEGLPFDGQQGLWKPNLGSIREIVKRH